jgi:hypothetical protein
MTTYQKSILASALLSVSEFAFAVEALRLFPIYPTTSSNMIASLGNDLPNTDFAVNTVQINVFQPCSVLQFGGFRPLGVCGAYKTAAQLWIKAKSTLINTAALPIAVLQYPTTQSAAAYATPNGQPFIVGNLLRYAQQSCDATLVDTSRYAVVATEPCIAGMQAWKRIAPLQ